MQNVIRKTLGHLNFLRPGGPLFGANTPESKKAIFTSHPFLALGTADGPGMTYLYWGVRGSIGELEDLLPFPEGGRERDETGLGALAQVWR